MSAQLQPPVFRTRPPQLSERVLDDCWSSPSTAHTSSPVPQGAAAVGSRAGNCARIPCSSAPVATPVGSATPVAFSAPLASSVWQSRQQFAMQQTPPKVENFLSWQSCCSDTSFLSVTSAEQPSGSEQFFSCRPQVRFSDASTSVHFISPSYKQSPARQSARLHPAFPRPPPPPVHFMQMVPRPPQGQPTGRALVARRRPEGAVAFQAAASSGYGANAPVMSVLPSAVTTGHIPC
eukprot:TRINITY_DN51617_c0_g1_i1.p1 TRINITY_DN51617_c0_g1~~TRINITY_DN51617_c0_g1_i1.p1  ORF type:complete len:235 (-),score=23.95 TRINITY_DN51617_c0_g1_i1:37-741(-)